MYATLVTWVCRAAVAAAVTVLVGCAASSGGFPPRSEDEKKDLQALESVYKGSARIAAHYALPVEKRRDDRDDLVNGRLSLIDANYKMFVRDFVIEKQRGDTATDITVIGLNSAGALIVPSSTTRILAGIAAAITGSKASFDKNFYYEQTAKALYTAMNAQRKDVRARILTGLTKDIGTYPLSAALADLDDYYMAGTFLGALQAIQSDAGVKDSKAQGNIDKLRGYFKDPSSQTVELEVDKLADAIANKLGTLSTDKLKTLIQAIDTNAPESTWANTDAARQWLIDRQRQNHLDDTKVHAMFSAFQSAGLVQP